MARYGIPKYKGAFYGEVPRTPFSVEPFSATAIDYDKVFISWNTPAGELSGIRLVRNQEGFSECPEDGVVLFEANSTDNDFGATSFTDGLDNFLDDNPRNDIALVSGRWVYYRMWVRRNDNLWAVANDIFIVLPKKHGTNLPDGTELQSTQINFMDLLPRVFTSAEQSPLGAIDPSSTLYQFLEGMSFTLDEMLTLADLLLPDYSGKNSGPGLLQLKQAEYGLEQEEPDAIVRKKRLVREAFYMYARKGTLAGLSTMIESLTGWGPTIAPTNNLMLTVQDGTFYKGTGSWRAVGPGTVTVETKVRTPDVEASAIDYEYCAKVVTTGADARLENGTYRPTTRGIPLPEVGPYSFSYYVKTSSGTKDPITASIVWYNQNGVEISRSTETSADVTTDWERHLVLAQSPGFVGEIVAYSADGNLVTLTLSEVHDLEVGQLVSISGLGNPFDASFELASVTEDTVTFALVVEDVEETEVEGTLTTEQAVYAGVVLSFAEAGTYYVDLTSFASGPMVDYEEPRGVNVFLNSTKANYINNPSFVEEGSAWDVSGASSSFVESTLPFIYAGDEMLALSPSGSADLVLSTTVEPQGLPVEKPYVFSIYLQTPDPREVTVTITASDGENTVTKTSSAFTIGTEWTRPYIEAYVSSDFDSATLEFELTVNIEGGFTSSVHAETAQLEVGYYPTDYFDGSYPPEYGVTWAGEPDESASHCYKIKQVKIIRLIQELENYLPSNTPYNIQSYAGTEVTGITL
jgi:hypothetical protein